MKLENKTILITGASTGIGKALAKELSNYSVNLFLTARRIELLEDIKKELSGNKASISVYKCDTSSKKEVEAVYKAITKTNTIDIAILNAGTSHHVNLNNFKSELAEKTFAVNVLGLIYWIEQLLPSYLKNKKGMIVGVSSLADVRGFSGSGFYCASKAAATIYLEGLRVELKPHNINVITVRPGFVKTPMAEKNKFDMPFLMETDKAAKIIIKGIKKGKRVIQFPWQTVWLTRLVKWIPASLYEYLAVKGQNINK